MKKFRDDDKNVVVNGVTFSEDLTELIRYPEDKKGNFYSVPDSVESIEDGAFFGCKALTNIYIPDTVYHIGCGAFKGCDNLKEIMLDGSNKHYKSINGQLCDKKGKSLMDKVSLPDIDYVIPKGITELTGFDNYTMEDDNNYCYKQRSGEDGIDVYGTVRSVTIPKRVTGIPHNLFYIFDKVQSIEVDPKNPSFKSIDGVLFSKDGKRLVAYPAAKPGSEYTVPDGVTVIGERAFSDCEAIETVKLPASIERIERYAFHASGLRRFEQPKALKRICANTFSFCCNLESVELKEGLRVIDDSAFDTCSSLEAIELPDSLEIIGKYAFDCCALRSIKLGPKVQTLIDMAFASNNLESIEFGKGITFIGDNAFYNNPIKMLDIPDNVKVIDREAFGNCENLTKVHIGKGLSYIDSCSFSGCKKLAKVTVDRENPKYCGFNSIILDRFTSEIPPLNKEEPVHPTFEGLRPVITLLPEGLVYPNRLFYEEDGVLFVGKKLFKYPAEKKDASYTIPDWVDDIEPHAFKDCLHLEEVTLSPNIGYLIGQAFQECNSIKKVVIPSGVTHIGQKAFESCKNLRQVVLSPTLEGIGKGAFAYCENLRDIELPDGLEVIGIGAFFHCSKLKAIKIPGSVRVIQGDSFCQCTALKSLVIENGVTMIERDAFEGCENLIEVRIPESVTQFESGVFAGCTKLKKIILPNTFHSEEGLFTKCENLSEITFADGEPATRLSDWIFTDFRIDL